MEPDKRAIKWDQLYTETKECPLLHGYVKSDNSTNLLIHIAIPVWWLIKANRADTRGAKTKQCSVCSVWVFFYPCCLSAVISRIIILQNCTLVWWRKCFKQWLKIPAIILLNNRCSSGVIRRTYIVVKGAMNIERMGVSVINLPQIRSDQLSLLSRFSSWCLLSHPFLPPPPSLYGSPTRKPRRHQTAPRASRLWPGMMGTHNWETMTWYDGDSQLGGYDLVWWGLTTGRLWPGMMVWLTTGRLWPGMMGTHNWEAMTWYDGDSQLWGYDLVWWGLTTVRLWPGMMGTHNWEAMTWYDGDSQLGGYDLVWWGLTTGRLWPGMMGTHDLVIDSGMMGSPNVRLWPGMMWGYDLVWWGLRSRLCEDSQLWPGMMETHNCEAPWYYDLVWWGLTTGRLWPGMMGTWYDGDSQLGDYDLVWCEDHTRSYQMGTHTVRLWPGMMGTHMWGPIWPGMMGTHNCETMTWYDGDSQLWGYDLVWWGLTTCWVTMTWYDVRWYQVMMGTHNCEAMTWYDGDSQLTWVLWPGMMGTHNCEAMTWYDGDSQLWGYDLVWWGLTTGSLWPGMMGTHNCEAMTWYDLVWWGLTYWEAMTWYDGDSQLGGYDLVWWWGLTTGRLWPGMMGTHNCEAIPGHLVWWGLTTVRLYLVWWGLTVVRLWPGMMGTHNCETTSWPGHDGDSQLWDYDLVWWGLTTVRLWPGMMGTHNWWVVSTMTWYDGDSQLGGYDLVWWP